MNSNPYSSGCICFHDCKDWDDYTIKENDTLYNISVKFGVPIRMLMSCNKSVNPYNLQPGQIIKVPSTKPGAMGCIDESEDTYTIELHDTLFNISEKFETSVEEIIQMNPGIDPYNLKPGIKICVPKKKPAGNNNIKPVPNQNLTPNQKPATDSSSVPAPNQTHLHNLIHSTNQKNEPNINSKPIEMSSNSTSNISMQMNSNMNANYMNNNRNRSGLTDNSNSGIFENTNNSVNNSNIENPLSCPNVCIGKYYIIQDSDTPESILESINLTYAALAFANPTVDFCNLISGTKICIPHHDMFKGCNSGTSYIIKTGDSLSSLSKRFNVVESAMLSANPFNKISDFSTPGIRICIPE